MDAGTASSPALADWDGDADLDLVVTESVIALLVTTQVRGFRRHVNFGC